jgi:uncharacterized protein YciI
METDSIGPDDQPTLEQLLASLASFDLYRVIMRPNAGFRLDPVVLREHLLWLKAREQEGRLVLAGPIDRTGDDWDGTGMSIFRGASRTEVEELVAAEPFHAAGLRTNEVSHWQVNEGSLSVRVDLFSGRGSFS